MNTAQDNINIHMTREKSDHDRTGQDSKKKHESAGYFSTTARDMHNQPYIRNINTSLFVSKVDGIRT